MTEVKERKILIGDKEAIIKVGEYALQANGSVVVQCGETVVHAVVVMGSENPDQDFFPTGPWPFPASSAVTLTAAFFLTIQRPPEREWP